ncbi:MAG: Do family serine endopeptidase [Persicimonas sp.]
MNSSTHSARIGRLIGALLAGGLMLVGVTAHAQQDEEDDSRVWVEESDQEGIDPDAPLRFSSLSSLAERLSPSVVNVIVSYEAGDEIERLLGEGSGPRRPNPAAQGTGFIIHPDGYILTNNHVVAQASSIKIKLLDGTEYEAELKGVDPQTDVALLKIDADRELSPIALGDSDDLSVGDHVIAIGNPLGLSHTVTTGIVSALERRDLPIEGEGAEAEFIQTDASINPGNSGGPLIDLHGDVVGMNTAINQQAQGIGFAIPISMIKQLLPELAREGYVERSWLGIRVQGLDENLAKSFGLDNANGALITEIVDDGPAQAAGLKEGDVVLEFDGNRIESSDRLPWLASTAGVGRTVELTVMRENEPIEIDIELESLPDQEHPKLPEVRESQRRSDRGPGFGINVKSLTDSLARQLGASSTDGVVVTSVDKNTPAESAGLRERDVITEIDDDAVESTEHFDDYLAGVDEGEIVRLKVLRGGRVVYVAIQQ